MYLELVKEFHSLFNHPIDHYSNEIPLATRQLRIKLFFEEFKEHVVATDTRETFYNLCKETVKEFDGLSDGNNVDKVESVDSLADMCYIFFGSILALGHQDNFDNAFIDVHSSNMSKACNNLQEAEETVSDYLSKSIETYYVEKDGKYLIYRSSDNKVLKSLYYNKVILDKYVE